MQVVAQNLSPLSERWSHQSSPNKHKASGLEVSRMRIEKQGGEAEGEKSEPAELIL
jgi:hypothetical protein